MSDKELKEYEVLSEDRRRAVEIFLKGFIITSGIFAFGLKLLLDTKSMGSLLVVGISGFVFVIIGVCYLIKCRKHDQAIRTRLNKIISNLEMAPIICTKYIFDVALLVSALLATILTIILIIRIFELA